VADEYSEGDYSDGYVYVEETKVTYPKFRTPSFNHMVSLRHGVWDSLASAYVPSRLCIIDFPVLKAHSWAGSTIAIKNWIGVMTTAYSTPRYGGFNEMHEDYLFGPYALTAKILADTYPRLSIVDATWTTKQGPVNLTQVENTKVIMASTDPAAVSWYAAKHVLTPIAAQPYNTDPDRIGSEYRYNLSNWTTFLRDSAGYACTMDSAEMSIFDRRILMDSDDDGINDAYDNCPLVDNQNQTNSDGDSRGDACDNCITTDNEDQQNSDNDSYGDACDNCPLADNEDQADTDEDGIGDVCDIICGDANGDRFVNVGDAVFLINYIFRSGAPPDPECTGDANGDGQVNVGDAVNLINYIFRGGEPPAEICCP
jgi:hypothetical protein